MSVCPECRGNPLGVLLLFSYEPCSRCSSTSNEPGFYPARHYAFPTTEQSKGYANWWIDDRDHDVARSGVRTLRRGYVWEAEFSFNSESFDRFYSRGRDILGVWINGHSVICTVSVWRCGMNGPGGVRVDLDESYDGDDIAIALGNKLEDS